MRVQMAQLWLAANLLSEPKAHGGGLLARLLSSSSERRVFCLSGVTTSFLKEASENSWACLSAVTTSFLKEACEDSWAFCLSRVATSFLREASENSFKKFLKLGYCRIWNKSGGRRQCCRQRASHPSPLPGICVSTPPLRSPPSPPPITSTRHDHSKKKNESACTHSPAQNMSLGASKFGYKNGGDQIPSPKRLGAEARQFTQNV